MMIATVMQVILAVFIFLGGMIKILRLPFQVEHWVHYQYPLWFMTVTGVLELIGAIGLLGGIWNRYLAVGSGLLLIMLMLGAIHAHVFRAEQPLHTTIPATICLILSILVVIRNLKVFD
jgi:uncharacterized membrane protein